MLTITDLFQWNRACTYVRAGKELGHGERPPSGGQWLPLGKGAGGRFVAGKGEIQFCCFCHV